MSVVWLVYDGTFYEGEAVVGAYDNEKAARDHAFAIDKLPNRYGDYTEVASLKVDSKFNSLDGTRNKQGAA